MQFVNMIRRRFVTLKSDFFVLFLNYSVTRSMHGVAKFYKTRSFVMNYN